MMFRFQPLEARDNLMSVGSTANGTRLLSMTKRLASPLLVVLILSALISIVFLKALPDRFRHNEETDYFFSYEPIARNLLAGRGVSRDGEHLATEYPPGYSLILAAIYSGSNLLGVSEDATLSAFAVICMALVSGFVFLLARMFWGTLPALISALVWMTYPFGLWLTKQPNSELPFMVVLYGGFCLFWYALSRRLPARVYFVCGLIFGAAMLIRPIAMGIGLVLSVLVWFTRREMSRRTRGVMIAMLLVGSLIAILPWEAWVYHKTGQVIPLGSNGVKSMRDGLTFAVWSKGYREEGNTSPDVLQVMENIRAHEEEISTFGDFRSVMSREFRDHPVGMTKLLLLKLGRSWYGTDSKRMETPILLIQLAYLLLVGWGAWNAWKRGGKYRGLVIGVLLITVYFWGMTFLALSILRYLVPVVGLLFVLVAGCYPRRLRTELKPANT